MYELLHDGAGQANSPHLPGLTDPATLTACDYDPHHEGAAAQFEATARQFEPTSSPGRAPVEAAFVEVVTALQTAAGGR